MSIGRAITWLADQAPDEVAVVDERTRLTRGELDRVTDRAARALVEQGVRVDHLVALDLPSPLDLLLASVAVWKAGGTPMPLRVRGAERAAVLALADPVAVIDEVRLSDDDAPLPELAASSWKVAPSSGSTGRPKLVRATAPARVDPAGRVAEFVPGRAVQLVSGPLAHAAAYTYAMRGLMTGHRLVLMDRFDAAGWLRLVEAERVTWAPLNPAMMRAVIDAPERARADVSSVESVLHLGARCAEDLKRAWLSWLGPERVVEVYAGSESQGLACISGREWLEHPGSVGRGAGGTEFRVAGPDGRDCAPGELGEILMRRPGVAYDYIGAGTRVRDGWHSLGDAGWLDADGYLFVGDRLADLVTTPAGLVLPADVEAVLDAHPAVRSSAAVAAPGGGLLAVVETVVPVEDLQAWVDERLPPQQRPTAYRVVGEAVRDDAGKVRRSDWVAAPAEAVDRERRRT